MQLPDVACHRVHRTLVGLLVLGALTLAGCGQNTQPSQGNSTTAEASTNDTAVATDAPVTLTLLAHDSFTPSEGIFDAFTAETGIVVRVVRGGDAGTLVTKAVVSAG
ncbi:MAG: hypothetical protein EBZ88_06140, partial [Actinobacteria bacterium]|nr:hypothetical protein [Actinomycetota bacterium]